MTGWTRPSGPVPRRRTGRPPVRAGVAAAATATIAVTAGCGGAFDPEAEESGAIAGAWWLMFGLGTAVFAFVLVVLAVALRRGRRREEALDPDGDSSMSPLILGGGVVLPAVVIALLVGVTVWMGDSLTAAEEDALRIEVVGHQYWWDVTYPELGIRTANEIHVPVDRQVELHFTSDDVIHSFWVPQLHGKIDLIPGRSTTMPITAETAGTYRGQCAEFCGVSHAWMRMIVVADEPTDFDAWAEGQTEPPPAPSTDGQREGRDVFLGSACVYCHAVEGTNASSEFGPDLSHLASRRTLAAGVLPNTRGDLAGWILDPQRHKPGNEMPATALPPDELNALLDYLETLE